MKEAFSYPFKKVYLKATFACDVCSSCCMIATTECYNYEILKNLEEKALDILQAIVIVLVFWWYLVIFVFHLGCTW